MDFYQLLDKIKNKEIIDKLFKCLTDEPAAVLYHVR